METAQVTVGPAGSVPLAPFRADSTVPAPIESLPPSQLPAEPTEDDSDAFDMAGIETLSLKEIGNADAESIFQVSMSRAATRLQSARTPAAERAAAMDIMENGEYFVGEEDDDSGSATPTQEPQERGTQTLAERSQEPVAALQMNKDIPRLPSPWRPGPKPLERSDESRSALKGALSLNRRRSLSGSAENIKRLLPSLPSLPKASSLIPNLPSPSFFGGHRKTLGSSRDRANSRSKGSVSPARRPHASFSALTTPKLSISTATPNSTETLVNRAAEVSRPPLLHRASSHESLLYHSLSRASSLGDDTRFASHRVQVNSRAKAIRDSIQDRSSFRMPQVSMPSMPQVPLFMRRNLTINFAQFNPTILQSPEKNRANLVSQDILPVANKKKTPHPTTFPAIAPGLSSASVARPELSVESPQPPESAANLLEQAIEGLTGDVVIMGGYRGSILRDTKTKRRVWVTQKVGVNIRRVNLEVGLTDEDEERMEETIYPDGMLKNIGPVDISRRLFKRLRESENAKNGTLRVWDYGYDWRLSPHLLSRKLVNFLKELPSNQPGGGGALVLAHSLGGLITRHAVNQHPELFSGVIYAGVPQACVNILGPLHKGDAVLFSQRVLTAQVNFTLRTSFLLLPTNGYCFVNINNPKEEYPVDFFNVDHWIKYRWSPCTDPPLPPKNPSQGLTSLINFSGSLPSLPLIGKNKSNGNLNDSEQSSDTSERKAHEGGSITTAAANKVREMDHGKDRTIAPQMGNLSNPAANGQSTNASVSTTVTLPREKCIEYLSRVLPQIKRFKQETHHNAEHEAENRYPPIAVLYGKNIPTVYAAKVDGEDGIPCADVYENLGFASGDGVVLAKMAMVPRGYRVVGGGRVPSGRGHVTLLGDLAGVGKCIAAVRLGRERGIGLGKHEDK